MPTLVKNRKSRIFAWAYVKNFFSSIFLDVFLDVDSGDKEGFDFRPSGAEISTVFLILTPTQGNFT